MKELTIFSEFKTPRLDFTLQFIFEECFRINYKRNCEKNKLSGHKNVINYSEIEIPGSFHVFPSGLLNETGINQKDPRFFREGDLPLLFPVEGGNMPYDPFSAVFFMISRYEEYLPSERDQYGRFMPSSGITGREGILELPLVNAWLLDLKEKLVDCFQIPDISFPESRFIPTIDIDNPWAVRNKSFFRKSAGMIKDLLLLKFNRLSSRVNVLMGREEDPFFTFPGIDELHDENLRIFILIGNKSRKDSQISPDNAEWRELIRHLDTQYTTGMHPSYFTNRDISALSTEKRKLEEILDHKVTISRQHFLKLEIPGTYRALLSSGINEDHSMGFASATGFRAGTTIPFYFYDLEKEVKTALKIYPFALMDRTLKDYMKLDPRQAKQKIDYLVGMVEKYGGNLISVWHNESIGNAEEWKGWLAVYEYLLKAGRKLNN